MINGNFFSYSYVKGSDVDMFLSLDFNLSVIKDVR